MSSPVFAKLVRRRLKERDISIREVCRFARIDPSYMAKVLRGERNPPDDEKILFRLSEILRVDPVRLFVSVGRIPAVWQDVLEDDERLRRLKQLLGEISSHPSSDGTPPVPARKSPREPDSPEPEESEMPKRPSTFFEREMSEDLL